ncbi:hypothetical protein BGZ95_004386 [Linnemannia exigua]|uniref:G domain-containing protein n=1 Tax=Linnemannia exigua TaxID=604196 RepID=A0AAD4H344_9FUNG|nr:hypothetical protein BGZ95_004386 [Linnemannia exigua]
MRTQPRPGTQSRPHPPPKSTGATANYSPGQRDNQPRYDRHEPFMPSDNLSAANSQYGGTFGGESMPDYHTAAYPTAQRNNHHPESANPAACGSNHQYEAWSDYAPKNGSDGAPQETTNVVFVGNPGVGKSALLNVFGGSFKSGCSEVAGLTREVTKVPTTFYGRPLCLFDVPGIDDCIEEGGEDTIVRHLMMLQEALNGGGHFVIFFVITPRNGRIEPSDYMMMKTVLDSLKQAPKVGLILTQVKRKQISQVQSLEYTRKLMAPLEKIVESSEFLARRYPLVLIDHSDGEFGEEEKSSIIKYVFSFEPKPVISRNMVDQVVRRFFGLAKMGMA